MDFYCWQLGLMEGDAKPIATIALINLVPGRKYSPLLNTSHLKLQKHKKSSEKRFQKLLMNSCIDACLQNLERIIFVQMAKD